MHTRNDSMEESKRWKRRMNEKGGKRKERKREKEGGGLFGRLYFDSRATAHDPEGIYIHTDAL